MSRLSAVAITGNLTSPSRSAALGRVVLRALESQHAFDTTLFEIAHVARSLGQSLNRAELPIALESTLQSVETADVLVVVTPVHRGSFSGLLKHFFDLLGLDSLRDVPVILAATGGSERHGLVLEHALRPLLSFFGAQTVPTALFATERDFDSEHRPTPHIEQRAARAAKQALVLLHPPFTRRFGHEPNPALEQNVTLEN
jgi:FMN reductase